MNEQIIQNNHLILKSAEFEDRVTVVWEGKSTERDPSVFLTPLFNDLLEKNKSIVMDFKKLEYMNSSTLTPLLKVLDRLKITGGNISIIYDKGLKWQDLSFSALQIFQTKDNNIRIVGE